MTLQICPKCKKKGFTWTVDEEISPLTIWDCVVCGYDAKEDESQETECPKCKQRTFSYMVDGNGPYWWCCNCNYIQSQ